MPTDILTNITTGHILSIQGILGIIRWTHFIIITFTHIQTCIQLEKLVVVHTSDFPKKEKILFSLTLTLYK